MSDDLEIPVGDVTSKFVLVRHKTICETCIACRSVLEECLDIAHLTVDGWSQKMLDSFNRWAETSGALEKKSATVEERLATLACTASGISALLGLLHNLIVLCQPECKKTNY